MSGPLRRSVVIVDFDRVTAFDVGGQPQSVTDPEVRRSIRRAMAHHFGLEVPASADGAA
jgi:hypothetical protein